MRYKNAEMKIAELVTSFKEETISLIPPFQRGRVWSLETRQKLLENIVRGKPIPAIFLYKQAVPGSSAYAQNILDGKQRLESLLLFIADKRSDLSIPNWKNYFFRSGLTPSFKINTAALDERANKKSFAELHEDLVREFREYRIPTIEIDLDREDGSLDEIISLFIDINQKGVKVSRWDIVRTMKEKNPLLGAVFNLVALRQKRKKDYFYKMKSLSIIL